VSSNSTAETIEAHGCSIVLRRVAGPEARELFFSCQPATEGMDAGRQAEALYSGILDILEAEGGNFGAVVSETVFLRNLKANIEPVRSARKRILASSGASHFGPAVTEIEQAPLTEGVLVEVLVQAVLPNALPLQCERIEARPECSCAECAALHGLRTHVGEEARFYAGSIYGRGEDAYEQTLAMFGVAEQLLRQAGMQFGDVMRTWIYFPEMERDYAGFNRARREFFHARGVDPVPASTGIGAGLVPAGHVVCLGVYAVKSTPATQRIVMTTPTLNEAPVYGSDFSRGMRIHETNKVALHISGTASLDETGKTLHLDDFEAQADRMLLNVAALLKEQGATFSDVVSAMTYLKHPADAQRLRQKFHEAGYDGFPNVVVQAPVCRPELLCETEALAVLARTG